MRIYIQEFDAACGKVVKSGDNSIAASTTRGALTIGKKHRCALLQKPEPKLEFLPTHSLQPNLIAKTMLELQASNTNKRRKTEAEHARVNNGNHVKEDGSITLSTLPFDIFSELEAHPNAIQFVATSGGLVTQWNEAFSNVTNIFSSKLIKDHLTIFELVDSKSLPLLYSMLAMSLHGVPIVEAEIFGPDDTTSSSSIKEEEERVAAVSTPKETTGDDCLGKKSRSSSSSVSHFSITLPCKSFHNSSTRYHVTIVYMDDILAKRCFLGILTPSMEKEDPYYSSTKFTYGKVLRINDDFLCQLLFGSK